MRCAWAETPFGTVRMTEENGVLTELCFSDAPQERESADCPVFRETVRWLSVYASGRQPDFRPKLSAAKTPFQAAVRTALLSVPYGETVSYAALAARLHTSPRAVGRAVGRNPILLIVPCHRVIGKDGSPTGYAGGLARKEALLAAERTEGRTPEK